MLETPPTLIGNLPRKCPKTRMSKDQCCQRRCSSNLLAGHTIDLSQVSAMLVGVSKILPLAVSGRTSVYFLYNER